MEGFLNSNAFYKDHSQHIIFAIIFAVVILLCIVGILLYQVFHRPMPAFFAVEPNHNEMRLSPYDEPNLLPNTILTWASKAATAAYTFDFVNYRDEIDMTRPYFTENGWGDYLASVQSLLGTVIQNKLFVNGVVAGTPVISNQGDYPGLGYVWRIQIPFLVTYQSANTTSQQNYMVTITIVKIPTTINPQGIGIDQFVMS